MGQTCSKAGNGACVLFSINNWKTCLFNTNATLYLQLYSTVDVVAIVIMTVICPLYSCKLVIVGNSDLSVYATMQLLCPDMYLL